jgi:hypothetical protein
MSPAQTRSVELPHSVAGYDKAASGDLHRQHQESRTNDVARTVASITARGLPHPCTDRAATFCTDHPAMRITTTLVGASKTFRVLKTNEVRQFGEVRTQQLVLEAWDRLFGTKA